MDSLCRGHFLIRQWIWVDPSDVDLVMGAEGDIGVDLFMMLGMQKKISLQWSERIINFACNPANSAHELSDNMFNSWSGQI